ncbi:MAG: membrane protein insertion efficiency factor YidD [Clostridiales bacterium]|nr:membrane protein insertion efficiency factor YidD [Clostridiales bacterium]
MFKIYYVLTYPLTLICLFLIFIYRKVLSVAKGGRSCHFVPTCSQYAWDSIREFGAIWGGFLAFKRLLKCRPNTHGGVDYPKLNLLGNYKWKC